MNPLVLDFLPTLKFLLALLSFIASFSSSFHFIACNFTVMFSLTTFFGCCCCAKKKKKVAKNHNVFYHPSVSSDGQI